MKQYAAVIKDGIILLVVSTLFVTVCNQFFKGLKKSVATDPMITAVVQGKLEGLEAGLGDQAYADADKKEFATKELFQKNRANRQDEFGRTPLMWVAYANFSDAKETQELDKKRLAFVEFMAKNGADLNAKDKDGWTPLMWASWSGLNQVAAKLVELGASGEGSDRQGNTALTLASQKGNAEIVKLLLSKNVDKGFITKSGKKAADFAREGLSQFPEKAAQYQSILGVL
ncbi:ankyrin repeat domain-containing protein [Bdellovibrionota bacterium FG-2]